MSAYASSKDFYRVLRVPHTATLEEIKVSYRRLALRLHPDMHKNDPQKTKEFKLVNEAYAILSDEATKKSYDFDIGNRYNRSRRTPPPPNYRKVYTSRPPPDWKTVWDHKRHYDMHYGDGLQEEALRQARKTAFDEGLFEYHSPLGAGFTFSDNKADNVNPFSKHAQQGPIKVVFEYEESYKDAATGKDSMMRRERVVEDLHGRREQRHTASSEALRRQQQRYNSAFARSSNDECVIL